MMNEGNTPTSPHYFDFPPKSAANTATPTPTATTVFTVVQTSPHELSLVSTVRISRPSEPDLIVVVVTTVFLLISLYLTH